MLVVCTGIASSCKYDDDELWGSVDDLANRISAMETLTQQMNSDIAALQAIVTAVENQVAVSEVEKLTDGYILHFTNGETATIKNGIAGEDGTDGEDGIDGKDAPAIGIEKENGVYYWTLTVDGKTEWLTDDAGNKLTVTGSAGSDGTDGSDGSTGATGAAGKTPTLKVDAENGFWMISYDGTKFEYILDANDDEISALGTIGEARFLSVDKDEVNQTIIIVMNDDNKTTHVLPLLKNLIFYDKEGKEVDIKNIEWDGQTSIYEFTYKLELKDANHVKYDESGVTVSVEEGEGKVTLELGGNNSISDARAVVLFYNDSQTLTAVFKFKIAPWKGADDVAEPESSTDEAGKTTYSIVTPGNLAWIAQQVNSGAGNSFANENISLINDIDLGGYQWTPIGESSATPFSGIFKGNGKQIKGLSVGTGKTAEPQTRSWSRTAETETDKEIKGAGLFGVVKGATLSDVTITDAVVNPEEEVAGAGVLVGCALDVVTIEGVTIEKETPKEPSEDNPEEPVKDVTGSQNVGSVAGYISGNEIKIADCTVRNTNLTASTEQTSSTETSSVGGVVGTINVTSNDAKVEISNCTVGGVDLEAASSSSESGEGTQSSNNTVGGVVGTLTTNDGVTLKTENMTVTGNTVADATVVVPDGTEVEDVEFDSLVGNSGSLGDDVKENINSGNTIQDMVVDASTTIKNAELSTVLLAELGADKVTLENGYAKMKISDVEAVTEFDFSYKNYKVTSLSPEDIGKFKNLRSLDCRGTQLASCDLSLNTELVYVNIQSNALVTLDFSQNTKLGQLICSYNPSLTTLKLDNCNELSSLQTQDTGLTSLVIPNKERMTNFLYGNTGLANVIDLNEYPNITSLGIMGLGYTSIDVIPDNLKAKINTLFCEKNNFEVLDLSKFPNLTNLTCYENKIKELDIRQLPDMGLFQCGNQKDNIFMILKLTEAQNEKWTSDWGKNSLNQNVKVIADGSIEDIALNGGTFTVNENFRLTTPLIVEKDMMLKIEGGWLGATSGDAFMDPDKLKTLIAVKPGATLTVEGSNQLNTGHVMEQLSCIRLLGGSDEASKVVINDGLIIGTYYAIVVDEDCQNAEVEINGGSLSCDWNKEFNGTAIMNKGNALINIKGGHVSSCASAVEMWNGTFTMSGGTLESTYQGEKSHVNNNGVSDNAVVGSALALYPSSGKTVTATISDGTLQGLSSIYEISANETGNVSLSVTDGKFEGSIISYNCTGFISGGKYKVKPEEVLLAPNAYTEQEGDYTIVKLKVDVDNDTSLPSWGKEELGNN